MSRDETLKACGCCGGLATAFVDTPLACCAFCRDRCRAPGSVDANWYHDVIACPTLTDSQAREIAEKATRNLAGQWTAGIYQRGVFDIILSAINEVRNG